MHPYDHVTQIRIHDALNAILAKDPSLAGAVYSSVSNFSVWLSNFTRGLPFFPDYTDHGPDHINDVIRSGWDLIRPCAHPHLTPHDAAAFVLASVLHDSAMHLDQQGFLELISGTESPLIPKLDSKSWADLWQQHLASAHRWDDRAFEDVFGQTERLRTDRQPVVRQPPQNLSEWDGHDIRLIGEFLRIHHPRLAHEIALKGVPGAGPASERLRLLNIPAHIADLAAR